MMMMMMMMMSISLVVINRMASNEPQGSQFLGKQQLLPICPDQMENLSNDKMVIEIAKKVTTTTRMMLTKMRMIQN